MGIKKEPFVRYNLEKTRDVITISLNAEERKNLEEWKHLIQQEKDGTAFKQLAGLGAKVLQQPIQKLILSTVLNNYRKNKRLGVITFD